MDCWSGRGSLQGKLRTARRDRLRICELVASVPMAPVTLIAQDETGQGTRGTSQNSSDCGASARDPPEQGSAAGAYGTATEGGLLLA